MNCLKSRQTKTPDAIALVFEDQQLTYRELNNRANQLAHYLQKLGVGPETLVGICVQRSLDMIIGLLGILKAGGAYLPIDAEFPAPTNRVHARRKPGPFSVDSSAVRPTHVRLSRAGAFR